MGFCSFVYKWTNRVGKKISLGLYYSVNKNELYNRFLKRALSSTIREKVKANMEKCGKLKFKIDIY